MNIPVKKIFRFVTYSTLVSVFGLISFLFSKNKSDHSITLNPTDIPVASADIPRGPGGGGDEGSDSGSGDSSGDM